MPEQQRRQSQEFSEERAARHVSIVVLSATLTKLEFFGCPWKNASYMYLMLYNNNGNAEIDTK